VYFLHTSAPVIRDGSRLGLSSSSAQKIPIDSESAPTNTTAAKKAAGQISTDMEGKVQAVGCLFSALVFLNKDAK
jgi:hypothetical protein